MSYRRAAVEAVGGFKLGYSCDETELCLRLTQRDDGASLLYLPHARVAHHVPEARGTLRHFLRRCWFEGGSKAVVAGVAGRRRGLESERAYTRRVLPSGVLRGIRDYVLRRDVDGLRRSAAIVAGLTATVAGYAAGSVRLQRSAQLRGWTGPALPPPWRTRTASRAG
jgi:hypothetical protein